ncbi:crtF Demethylspheroidene O-methyltransferase [Nymphaea thermarum]|nr:crtF Demethylspheroidene O-methyltransferase [Nymphaea thermarum]
MDFHLAWPHLHESVLDPRQEAFKRVHGVPVYEYNTRVVKSTSTRIEVGTCCLRISTPTSCATHFFVNYILKFLFHIFNSKTKIDFPELHAPYCLEVCPKEGANISVNATLIATGVTHIGGSMFDSVPQGDAIFMKPWRVRTLVTDCQGLSLGAYVMRNCLDPLVQAWTRLHESVLDPSQEAFKKVHGLPVYEYYIKDPACNSLMQRAMSGLSVPFMKALLDSYDGFGSDGLKTIVDVGGGTGSCMAMIVERYPGLQGINFDLPEVVANAQPLLEWGTNICLNALHATGVTHVGGNMFDSVPTGDAMFIKGVLVSFSDEECKKMLENCHKALPEKGKVIACEGVVPENTDNSERTRTLLVVDIYLMAIHAAKCRNRTESEYRKLG